MADSNEFAMGDIKMLWPVGVTLLSIVGICYIHRFILMYLNSDSKKIIRQVPEYLKREQEHVLPNLMTFISEKTTTRQVRTTSAPVSMERDPRASAEFNDEIAEYYHENYKADYNDDFDSPDDVDAANGTGMSVFNVMHDEGDTKSSSQTNSSPHVHTNGREDVQTPPPRDMEGGLSTQPAVAVAARRQKRTMTITNDLQSGGHLGPKNDDDDEDDDVHLTTGADADGPESPPAPVRTQVKQVDWAAKLRSNSYAPPLLAQSNKQSSDSFDSTRSVGCGPDEIMQSLSQPSLLNIAEGDEENENEDWDESSGKVTSREPSSVMPRSNKATVGSETESRDGSMVRPPKSPEKRVNTSIYKGHQSIRIDYSQFAKKNISLDIVCLNLANSTASLVDLTLRGSDIKDEGAVLLSDALRVNQVLRTLDLSANNIEKQGATALAECFGSTSPAVFDHYTRARGKSLSTREARSHTDKEQRPVSCESEHLVFNNTLIVLDLSDNGIGPSGAKAFACALTSNTSLEYLELGFQHKGSKIGPDGATFLAYLLRTDGCALRYLGLARDSVCFEGIRHISSALQVNRTLTELDVGSVNFLTIAGSMQLAQAIRANRGTKLAFLGVGDHRLPVALLVGNRALARVAPTTAIDWQTSVRNADPYSPYPTSVEVGRLDSPLHNLYRERALRKPTVHGMDDEMGVVVANLLERNRSLFHLMLEKAKLPIQKLIGTDPVSFLNLSGKGLTSVDTIIIGSLIAENKKLTLINLKNNNFASSDGENFIAYALDRNLQLNLDTVKWSVEEMYTDGYKALAARQGMSASGVAIEPQRLEGSLYQTLTGLSALLFYLGLMADVFTIYSFASQPEIYSKIWIIMLSIIVCLPTAVFLFNTLRNLIWINQWEALWNSIVVVLQLTMAIQSYFAIQASMETTELLDYKFVMATYKSMPQIFFQMYIQFLVAIEQGYFAFAGLCSNLGALFSITVIFIMLFDRKDARRISMAAIGAQPKCAIIVADILTFFGMGNNSADVVDYVNFDAFYTAHYVLGYVFHISGLTPRVVCIAWFVASTKSGYHSLILLLPLWIRSVLMVLFDRSVFDRTVFNNLVVAISLVISDSAWKADMSNPRRARDLQIDLAYLSCAENLMSLYFAFFMGAKSAIPETNQFAIFLCMIIAMGLNWLTLHHWALPCHFPQLYLSPSYDKKQRRKTLLAEETAARDAARKDEDYKVDIERENKRKSQFVSRRSEYDRTTMINIGWNPIAR